MKDLYIIGAGDFGRETAWLVERINQKNATWNFKGFIDDNLSTQGTFVDGYPVVGGCDSLCSLSTDVWVVCAIASGNIKKKLIDKVSRFPNVKFATLVDPNVTMGPHVKIGEGCIICAGSIFTINIKIGNHVIVNLSCTVGHDTVLDDYVTLHPGVNASGKVHICPGCVVGTGSKIIQGLTIGEYCILGAGAVVTKDMPSNHLIVGVPAKPIREI